MFTKKPMGMLLRLNPDSSRKKITDICALQDKGIGECKTPETLLALLLRVILRNLNITKPHMEGVLKTYCSDLKEELEKNTTLDSETKIKTQKDISPSAISNFIVKPNLTIRGFITALRVLKVTRIKLTLEIETNILQDPSKKITTHIVDMNMDNNNVTEQLIKELN